MDTPCPDDREREPIITTTMKMKKMMAHCATAQRIIGSVCPVRPCANDTVGAQGWSVKLTRQSAASSAGVVMSLGPFLKSRSPAIDHRHDDYDDDNARSRFSFFWHTFDRSDACDPSKKKCRMSNMTGFP
jgi:hypothetical protein